ncbi:hypothetical protein Bca52824_043746 [Brassica carinata]|uniref:Uncharacterized protein n=1 Tax=Brassica carinata TaxID=52824 RepID=A0A8X7UZZ1_BRACI|nr:hypothetical protein Bca52824_043746 [Brassica carinata]
MHRLDTYHLSEAGIPDGAKTTSDIPITLGSFLASAMNQHTVREYGAKSVNFVTISAAYVAISFVPGRSPDDLAVPPTGYPSSKVLLHGHETKSLSFLSYPFGDGVTFYERIMTGLVNCDVITIRTCQEIEGKFCDFIESQFQRKVLLTGPMLPEPDNSKPLEDQWHQWLNRFEPGSVVYCSLGSEIILEKEEFQEICLGMELTGSPFLVEVKPPKGASTIQEALPKGFEERVKERVVVWGGWVQQPLILAHPSVGCFENISVAVKCEMYKDTELGNLVRRNLAKWKKSLLSSGIISGYVNRYVM